jgi:hypothetical protein
MPVQTLPILVDSEGRRDAGGALRQPPKAAGAMGGAAVHESLLIKGLS